MKPNNSIGAPIFDARDAKRARRLAWKKKWRESPKGRAYQKKAHAEWRKRNKDAIAGYGKKARRRVEYRLKIKHYKQTHKANFIRSHSMTWSGYTNRTTWKHATMSKEFWDDSTDAVVMDATKTRREIAKRLGRSLASIAGQRRQIRRKLESLRPGFKLSENQP